jgi:hypothetical protein
MRSCQGGCAKESLRFHNSLQFRRYRMKGDDLVEIAGVLRRETKNAILVESRRFLEYFPKKIIADGDFNTARIGDEVRFKIPVWLARKKGIKVFE